MISGVLLCVFRENNNKTLDSQRALTYNIDNKSAQGNALIGNYQATLILTPKHSYT